MDLRQLKHFVGVAVQGSYTKAASALNVSQPALSRSVKMLEDRLNTTLFRRTPHGIEMTDDGDVLLRHASFILNSLQSAENELRASAKGGYREVRVGLASLFANMLADTALSELVSKDNRLQAVVQVGLYEEMERLLLDGALDLLVTTNFETEGSGGIQFEPLCKISSILVSGSEHDLAGRPTVTLEDVRHANWVTLTHPHMDATLASFFAQGGFAAPKSRVRTTSLEFLRSLLRKHQFVGFLPQHWAQADLEAGRLASLPVEGTPVRRMAGIVTRKGVLLSEGAKELINELRRVGRSWPDEDA